MLRRPPTSVSLYSTFPALALVLVALTLAACAQKSPEERVAEARTKYKVTLNAFLLQKPEAAMADDVMADEAMQDESAMADDTAATGAMAGDAMAGDAAMADSAAGDTMAAPKGDIFFDLIVQFDGSDPLPGITIEITQADPFEKEKATFRHYLETGKMVKSETKQVSFTVPGLDFEEGDLFSVDIRSHVPPEERGEYREFAEASFE